MEICTYLWESLVILLNTNLSNCKTYVRNVHQMYVLLLWYVRIYVRVVKLDQPDEGGLNVVY